MGNNARSGISKEISAELMAEPWGLELMRRLGGGGMSDVAAPGGGATPFAASLEVQEVLGSVLGKPA